MVVSNTGGRSVRACAFVPHSGHFRATTRPPAKPLHKTLVLCGCAYNAVCRCELQAIQRDNRSQQA